MQKMAAKAPSDLDVVYTHTHTHTQPYDLKKPYRMI